MLNLGTAAAKITLDISDLTSNANKANATINGIGAGGGKNLDTLQGKVNTYGASIQKVSTVVAGFGLAVTGAFGIAAKGAIGFDSAMGNVNSIAQLTKGQLSDLTNQVLDLSKATGQAPTTLADGLYDIESSGFKGADALNILTAAANAANAGLTDTGTSAAVITAVLNSYSLGADQAGHASDVLFQTVNDGVVTFGQLSQYMGQTLPIASALNVPIEQLGAAYALMTKNGLPVAETQTDINSLLTSALNPTTALTTAVQDYGYANAEALIKVKGLPGFLDFLTTASGGSATALTDLLGTQNASAAAMLLMKDGGKQYTDELGRMDNASKGVGATQTALNKQQDTTAFKLKQLAASFSVLEIRIGQRLEPVINTVAAGLTTLVNAISGLPTPVLAAIAAIGGIVGVVALVGGGIGLLLPKILEMKTAFGEVLTLMRVGAAVEGAASSFSLLSPPILIATAALVAFGIAYKTNFLGIKDGVNSVIDTVKGVAGAIFGDGASGKNDAEQAQKTFAKLTDTQKAYVRALQTAHAPQSQINAYLDSQNIAVPGVAKKYDLLTKTQRAWVDGLKASGQPQSVIDGYLKSQGVNAEYTTSQYKALRKEGMNPLSAELTVLGTRFGILNKNNPNKAFALLSKGLLGASKLTQTFGKYFGAAFGGNAEKYLKTLPAPLQGIAHGIGTVLDAAHDLNQAWKTGGFTGVIKELPHVIGNLGTAFRQGMTGVGDLFRTAANYAGPFSGTLKSIGSQFDDVGRLGQDMAKGLSYVMKGDWTNALKWGKEAVSDFGKLAKDSFDGVVNTAKGLGSVAADLGDWTINTAAPKVIGWIADHAGDVWSGIKDVAGWVWSGIVDLGQIAVNIAGWLVGLASDAKSLYDSFIEWYNENNVSGVIKNWVGKIASIAIQIGKWAIGAAISLFDAAKDQVGRWITAISNLPWGEIGSVIINIADWAWKEAVSLFDSGVDWVERAITTVSNLPWGEIGSVIINIAEWAWKEVVSLFDSGVTWVERAITAVSNLPWGEIGSVIVNIADWAWKEAVSLFDSAKDWVSRGITAIGNLPWGEIGSAIVNIAGWFIKATAPIVDAVMKWIGDAWGLLSGVSMGDLGDVIVTITSWSVKGAGSLAGKVGEAITGSGDGISSAVGAALNSVLIRAPFTAGELFAGAIWDLGGLAKDLADSLSHVNFEDVGQAIGKGLALIPLVILGLPIFATIVMVGFVTELARQAVSTDWGRVGTAIGHGLVNTINGTIATVKGVFEGFWSEVSGPLAKGWTAISPVVQPALDALQAAFGGAVGFIEDVWQGLADTLTIIFRGILNNINLVIDGYNKISPGPDIPTIDTSGMLTSWEIATNNMKAAGDRFQDSAVKNGQAVQRIFQQVKQAGYDAATGIGAAAKAAANFAPRTDSGNVQNPSGGGAPTGGAGGGGGGGGNLPGVIAMPGTAALNQNSAAISDMLANLSKMPSVANNATSGLRNLATSGIAAVTTQAAGATAATGATSSALGALDAVKAMPKIDLDKTKLDAGIADARHYDGQTLATAIVSIVAKQAGAGVVSSAKGAAASAIAAAGNTSVSTSTTNTVTTKFNAIDNASKTIGEVAAAIIRVPTSWLSALQQVGAEAVTRSAGITQAALEDIPVSWFTGISQAGAEAVTNSAGVTQAALEDIPTSWFTGISESGAESVAGAAYDAANAISSVPTSWYSTIGASVSGVGDVLALADAINAVHSVTVYVNAITSGGLSGFGNPKARGGYTDGALTLMAEQGPEALRFPDGSFGMANTKGVYVAPVGTFVFTAPKTKNMLDGAGPIPGYARGGYVRPWRAAAPTSAPTRSAARMSQTTYVTHVYAVKSDELVELIDNAQAGGDLARNLGPALTQIRQTASTPTVGRR